MKIAVVKLDAKKAGEIELDDAVFGIAEIRSDILQRMVRYQLSKRQAGTHATQSRSNVSRTWKKSVLFWHAILQDADNILTTGSQSMRQTEHRAYRVAIRADMPHDNKILYGS